MLDNILKNLLNGVSLIEDEFGSVNKILSRQIGAYATTSGRKVCFLVPPDREHLPANSNRGTLAFERQALGNDSTYDEGNESNDNDDDDGSSTAQLLDSSPSSSLGGAQGNAVVFRATDERYLPLQELKFDLVIFESFSSFLFGKTDGEVVELMGEIMGLSRGGNKMSFVLTSESGMLKDEVNAYIRASVDTVIIVKTEIVQNRVNRLLYIPKIYNSRPPDHVIKITIDDEGRIDVDTRELVG
jgi:hypothetical protein